MLLSENEGAKFWLSVLIELQNRGVKGILIACVDGLKGFPDAIQSVYPSAQIQLASHTWYVTCPRKVTADLKKIYQSVTKDKALAALDDFETRWRELEIRIESFSD